jgi:hypothetical protein
MSARSLNGPRPLFVVVGALVALALGSACGGSSTATPGPDASTEAGITIGTVMTTGGGLLSDGSTGMAVNPFGGSSSGGPSDDSGPASTDSGTGPDGSGLGDGSGLMSDDGGVNACPSTYTPPLCGTTPCDLRTNTCCIQVNIDLSLTATCVGGANAACNQNEVTVHCLQSCECGGTNVCCGVYFKLMGEVESVCQPIANLVDGDAGGLECNPYPQTNTQASAQLCKTDAECENGGSCVAQTCAYGAMLSICGVQSQDPFDCAPTN